MGKMVPFRYAYSYDIPRNIVLNYEGWTFFLHSAFDDELEDYPHTYYSVYRLPRSLEISLRQESWLFVDSEGVLEERPFTLVGKIEIESVIFDDTRSKELDASVLDPFTGVEPS
jgi:hypothetical protein